MESRDLEPESPTAFQKKARAQITQPPCARRSADRGARCVTLMAWTRARGPSGRGGPRPHVTADLAPEPLCAHGHRRGVTYRTRDASRRRVASGEGGTAPSEGV